MAGRFAREVELAQAEKDGFDSYPNARLNYPDPSDPLFAEKEARWLEGFARGKCMFDGQGQENEPDGTEFTK